MGEDAGSGTCPECGTAGVRAGQLLCRGCFVPFSLMAAARETVGGAVEPGSAGAPAGSGRGAAPTEQLSVPPEVTAAPPPTGRDTPPQALRLGFPDGQVVPVEPGVRVRLGRDPLLCPSVTFLAGHDNLSRTHAVVAVEQDGSAWIADEGSTNGTFVGGHRLVPEQRAALRPGDTVRLAADVTVRVLP